jgi:hypothetical protein
LYPVCGPAKNFLQESSHGCREDHKNKEIDNRRNETSDVETDT